MLAVLACAAPVLAGACAERDLGLSESPRRDESKPLVIDLSTRMAYTKEWIANTSDCSDQNYFCLEIPGTMALVFPRKCMTARNIVRPPTRVGAFKGVAPAPHLAPPSGSYIVEKYPRILMSYQADRGLTEVRAVRRSPYQSDFSPNNYTNLYVIQTKDGIPLFVCQ